MRNTLPSIALASYDIYGNQVQLTRHQCETSRQRAPTQGWQQTSHLGKFAIALSNSREKPHIVAHHFYYCFIPFLQHSSSSALEHHWRAVYQAVDTRPEPLTLSIRAVDTGWKKSAGPSNSNGHTFWESDHASDEVQGSHTRTI